ncbi:MAG TPA: carbohydrate kinase, partial [Caulobacteraceae bacterium]
TSLGCHTDLWEPYQNGPSRLSLDRHWAPRFGELRYAGDALGQITEHWAEQTGLTRECRVLCGLHDSNAALLAARGHPVVGRHDATVLSTGTWFVAMRSPSQQLAWQRPPALNERRDCLVNVDVSGWPTPSARFMGGREAELIAGHDPLDFAGVADPDTLIERLPMLMQAGVFVLPSFVAGVGPFPDLVGRWINEPDDQSDRRAVLGLYLALMADAALELIGSREMLIVEGRFAEDPVFVRALATLRPEQRVFVSNARDEVSYGALRLINPHLAPPAPLVKVEPLAFLLEPYRAHWRETLEGALA